MSEFTNHNGLLVHPEIYTYDYQGNTADHVLPNHPDFPAAVEALAKLVPEPFEWEPDGTSYTRRCVAGHVELKRKDGWVEAPVCTADFNAGRRYERERGHADE